MQTDMEGVIVDMTPGNNVSSDMKSGKKMLDSNLDDMCVDNLKYGVKVGNAEDYVRGDLNCYYGDQTVPLSQFEYMLGVPQHEWTSLQASLHGNEDLDIDPHYAFFGCNTESEVEHTC